MGSTTHTKPDDAVRAVRVAVVPVRDRTLVDAVDPAAAAQNARARNTISGITATCPFPRVTGHITHAIAVSRVITYR